MAKHYASLGLYSCRIAVCALGLASAQVMAANNPVDENWWPSEFGADDQSGAVNYITPEKRLEAVKLVKQGKTLTLGMPYQRGMPLASERTYSLLILGGGRPMQGPARWQGDAFKQTFNDEFVSTEIGQVGTQFDGLGHPMIRVSGSTGWVEGNYMYNKRRLEDYENGHGLQVNGVEHVAKIGFFTRGIMVDVAAFKGVDRLQKGEEISLDDFQAALQKQGIADASQGDVVLIRTGWIQLWKSYLDESGRIAAPADVVEAANKEFGSGEPGVSAELCDYLAHRKIAMLALDQGAVEPLDSARNPAPEPFGFCHMNLVTRRGIYLFENIDMEGLSQEKAYEFLFTWAPLKLVGATGSPGNPIVAW
jgi:kynurenine formamidase